jgi:hypothetical protein
VSREDNNCWRDYLVSTEQFPACKWRRDLTPAYINKAKPHATGETPPGCCYSLPSIHIKPGSQSICDAPLRPAKVTPKRMAAAPEGVFLPSSIHTKPGSQSICDAPLPQRKQHRREWLPHKKTYSFPRASFMVSQPF